MTNREDLVADAFLTHRSLAAELNNAGVALLESKQNQLAASAFGDAVRAIKRAQTILIDEESAESRRRPSDRYDYGNSIAETHQTVERVKSSLSTIHVTAADATGVLPPGVIDRTGLIVYSRPILLKDFREHHHQRQENAKILQSSIPQLLAVMLFNLGLTQHTWGVRTGNGRSTDKALQSYRIALSQLSLARKYNGDGHGSSTAAVVVSSHCLMLTNMAVLNNMGQILHGSGRWHVSTQYFGGLSSLLELHNVGGDDGSDDRGGRRVDWPGFALNVLFVLSSPSPAAPAA